MRIESICNFSNYNNQKSPAFNGEPGKVFYKYLEMVYKESKNPEADKIAQDITDSVNKLIKPLHKDTVFSIYSKKTLRPTEIPFPYTHNVYDLVDIKNYQSIFTNKKTGTTFAPNENLYLDYDGTKYTFPREGRYLLYTNRLEALKKHVDMLTEFFDKHNEFNIDTILYNLMLKKRNLKYSNSLIQIPPLRKLIYNRETKKAESLVQEFNITDKSKKLDIYPGPLTSYMLQRAYYG